MSVQKQIDRVRTHEPTDEDERLREAVVRALQTVYDPELPVNVYDLGLIYSVDVWPNGVVAVKMTLTAEGCPHAEVLPLEVQAAAMSVPHVHDCQVEVVWNPPWTPQMMSEAAKAQLGMT